MIAPALPFDVVASDRSSVVQQSEQQPERDERVRGGRLVGALYTMMAAIGLGVGGGWALDRHLGTSPRWLVGMSMLGLVVGFYHLVREALRK